MADRISDLDRQIAADPRHPASSALQRAINAEADLAAAREALEAIAEGRWANGQPQFIGRPREFARDTLRRLEASRG